MLRGTKGARVGERDRERERERAREREREIRRRQRDAGVTRREAAIGKRGDA